ncbi:coiled-coil domain-containing protein 180 [Latimeria chalumnae]
MKQFRMLYENICLECLAEIDKLREELLFSQVCTLDEVNYLVNHKLLPLAGNLQRGIEEELDHMDKSLEKLAERTKLQSKFFNKFLQGAAHLWEVHEIGLAHQGSVLQEKLVKCRQLHDAANNVKEATLDMAIDKLRQESCEEELKNTLAYALSVLEDIRVGYEAFHQKEVYIVESFPDTIYTEIISYSRSVSRYFGVKEFVKQESSHKCDEIPDSFQTSRFFTTSKGNIYTIIKSTVKHGSSKHSLLTAADKAHTYLKDILLPDNLLSTTRDSIRLNFFEHLEDWYGTTLANCKNTVVAKKEELDAELKVLLHLHKPRAKRIEMDVHNVRAAELLLHKERVESHSKGVTEALNNLKKEFIILSTEQKNRSDDFCKKIQDMEAIFVNATKSDRLPALTDSLRTELEKHMGTIKTSLRLYRHNLGESLGKLRDSNAEFIKSFRLFSEGGNFSPEEVEMFRRRLEKLAGRIDVIEGFFMADVEGMESKCLEEATEVISKFEDKFTFLTIDLIFMEKIQRLLLHLQIKIKTEVTNSNSQAQKLNSSLEQFEKKIDACAHPNLDKETVTPEALYSFLKTVIDEVNKRCKYLNCLLEPTISITPLLEIVTASRSYLENMKQDSRVTFLDIETLMQPSRMGKPATDDVAVGVIKTIMHTQKTRAYSDQVNESTSNWGLGGFTCPPQCRPNTSSPSSVPGLLKKSSTCSTMQKVELGRGSSGNFKRLGKPSRFDKKYLIFGEKQEEADHFKGILNSILWESSDALLTLAEDFYKRKEKRPVTRPEYLQETFEQCADVLIQKLQSYESQTDSYHSTSLQEFREQLPLFEELVSQVPPLLIKSLLKKHLEKLKVSMTHCRRTFIESFQEWDKAKTENRKQLRPTLGHPDKQAELESLCSQEEERESIQANRILINIQKLQDCVTEHAQEFVSAIATFAEKLLLEFDDVVTIDDVQIGNIEIAKEKTSTLLRRKRAGLQLENTDPKQLVERGSRTWPGVPSSQLSTNKREQTLVKETASITTAKTTLGHFSVVDARDRALMVYKQEFEKHLAQIEEQKEVLLTSTRRWEDCWRNSVLNIKQLYA